MKEETERLESFKKELDDLEELNKLIKGEEVKDIESKIESLETKIKEEEFKTFLSGKYDKSSAVLSIYAGAGGQDSQDWATMLLRMYERFCYGRGFRTKILHQSFGEGGGPDGRIGTKSVTLEIQGPYAFGFLKKESGVHRLVRISPFSPQQLRHTSFVLVEVLPEIEKEAEDEIKIKPEDLRIDFYRSSGPGGQHVNRRETAVRITHLPTNLVASCQAERSQGQNRERAMKMIYSKLYQLKEAEQQEKISQIKAAERQASRLKRGSPEATSGGQGKAISASWGNQIRSYVLHPYKLVKDLRTNLETSDVEGVLDGNLGQFIEAGIKI